MPTGETSSDAARAERDREYREVLGSARTLEATLCERFPVLFDRRNPLPLAIGIHDAITAAVGEGDLRVLCTFLRRWTSRWPYLVALAADGSARHALDGSVVEAVSDEHRRFAAYRIRDLKKRDRLAGTKPKTPVAPQPKTKARVEPPPPPPCRANSALPTLRLSRSGA